MKPAATLATFSDFRLVKTRKLAQLIFELPIEDADEALAALGGLPRSDSERWCGIALVTKSASPEADAGHDSTVTPSSAKAEDGGLSAPDTTLTEAVAISAPKQRRPMSKAQVAGMLCQDERFIEWSGNNLPGNTIEERQEQTAEYVRNVCNVFSRAQIDRDPEAAERWDRLHFTYLRDTGQMAEQRT